MTVAAVDRLVHRSTILELHAESYQRLRGAARSLVETAAQVAPAKPSEPDPYLEGRSE